jgi:hypothetical protein
MIVAEVTYRDREGNVKKDTSVYATKYQRKIKRMFTGAMKNYGREVEVLDVKVLNQ